MRWSVFVVLQALILSVVFGLVYSHQDRVTVLKEPPKSLAQWYKPQSKRHVWLHAMFKLRREMLAVEMYAKAEDAENLQKWAAKLGEDYLKISEMVPEWQNKLNPAAIADIQASAREHRYGAVADALADLGESCKSCHADYRAVTAILYRAPDFSKVKVAGAGAGAGDGDGAISLNAHMGALSRRVNEIVIAFGDGRQDAALAAFSHLDVEMKRLGEVCADCHKNALQSYPSAAITQAMTVLEQSLKTGTVRDQGKAIGTVAVLACAQCHGTHRLASDAKQLLGKQGSWAELLRHSF